MKDKDSLPPGFTFQPPENLDEWKSDLIKVNGIQLTVQEYKKDPKAHNSQPIPTSYLNSVYQDSLKSKSTLLVTTLSTQLERERSK